MELRQKHEQIKMTLTQRKAVILAEKKDRSVSGINIRTPNTGISFWQTAPEHENSHVS
jgi:hypothetical protein